MLASTAQTQSTACANCLMTRCSLRCTTSLGMIQAQQSVVPQGVQHVVGQPSLAACCGYNSSMHLPPRIVRQHTTYTCSSLHMAPAYTINDMMHCWHNRSEGVIGSCRRKQRLSWSWKEKLSRVITRHTPSQAHMHIHTVCTQHQHQHSTHRQRMLVFCRACIVLQLQQQAWTLSV